MDTADPEVSSGFLSEIGPGGRFYRYAQVAMVILALTTLTLLTLLFLPYFTGGKYQNPVSRLAGTIPIKYEKPKATLPPRITYPLPSGKQSWAFSRGSEVKGPKIDIATVDPLTPGKGDVQTVTITVKNDTPVTKAITTLFTDNQSLVLDLKLISGSSTDGTWAISWKISDTYNNIYHINFDLISSSGNWSGALTFR